MDGIHSQSPRLEHAPADLKTVTDYLRDFLLPIAKGLVGSGNMPRTWQAPGPWQ